MRQTILISTFVLLAAMWAQPRLTGADAQTAAPQGELQAPATKPTLLTPQPAATHPVYKNLRGQEGFWRVGQTAEGVWWFVSPDNKREFLNTVTSVQPFQVARDINGPSFVSSDYDGGLAPNGNVEAWATKTLARIRETGFKGLGAWSHQVFHKQDVPMTRDLNVWMHMHGEARLFYSPLFAKYAEEAIKAQVEPLKDNRNLIGYFIDNELDWGDATSGPGLYFDHLLPTDPNRAQVTNVIKSVWQTLENFNKDWDTKAVDWKEIDTWNTLPRPPKPYARLFSAWISRLAEDYFRLTTTLIHKYDQNHLILGVRYKGYALREVVRASAGYTDVQSLNYYPADAKLDAEMFRMLNELSGQPVMLSEYSFHALDGRSGNRNTVGFSAQVLDQQARADGYHLLTTRLARVPYVIGADWFQWNDEPPSGRPHDGEDANFGVVDIDDKPYDLLADAVRKTAPMLNELHAASHQDDGRDVWRESFAAKPVHRAPRLDKPIRINGELSDWPADAKIKGIRHSPTVGLERSKLPRPNVYMGWTNQGLYLAAEVFDNDIQGAPAQGWWWTRDTLEFWISTKPVASDQMAYDKHSHQFFFVPNSFPDGQHGKAGTAGQFKRPGDALKESQIPHPQIKEVCRIFPDRYVVEMFIPAGAMNGYDPEKNSAIAFNIHVRNYQHALDYFWSAPKDVLTHLRPATWGPVYLEKTAAVEQAMAK